MSRSNLDHGPLSALASGSVSRIQAVPLAEKLTAWLEPWQAFRALDRLPRPLFLDSSLSRPGLGRYSFLTADPFAWLCSRGKEVQVHGVARVSGTDPFAVLAHLLS